MIREKPEAKIPQLNKNIAEFRKITKLWPYLSEWRNLVLYAALLIPLILVFHAGIPLVIKYAIDQGMEGKDPRIIVGAALVIILLIVGEYLLRGLQSLCMATAVHRMIKNLRARLVRHVLKLSSRYHDVSLSGALVTRATSDFDNMSDSLNQGLLNAAVDIAVIAGAIGGLFYLDWKLASSVLVILPLVVLFILTCSRLLKSTMLVARVKIASLNAFTQECLMGLTTLKTLTAEQAAVAQVDDKAVAYRNAQMKTVVLDAAMFAVLDGATAITIGVFLWLALTPQMNLVSSSELTPGLVVAFVTYIGNLFDPLKQLGNKMAMMQGAFTSVDRIFTILETNEFIEGDDKVDSALGTLTFEDVRFRYNAKDPRPILGGVSFSVPVGTSLAIVGETGSGKSTVTKLISKLYDGYDGTIRFGDRDLARLDEAAVRERIAIVPQDITLFDGTIRDNITMGLPDIDDEDVHKSLTLVGAKDFVAKLPGGVNHKLSSQGAGLSQGQQQLIAFARALVRKPDVVILDEATSSVDPESEAIIQAAISNILESQTVIVIAHRLSTIRDCDRIMVMEQGLVLESGNHDQLMAQNGRYAEMVRVKEKSSVAK